MRLEKSPLKFVAIALIAAFGIVGCGGKDFTPEDFKKVTKDMPEDKVIEILGKPTDTKEAMGAKRLFWENNDKYYSISFKDGKVVEPMAHTTKEDYTMMKGLMDAAKQMEKK